ncbi:MAG: D-alanyl-D-alanine carboxypeptidase/D-alanyl-D-alanine-endopeptidase [Gemmatimonadales bacterium]|nr:D-alanyl-D-alanine carboxypeptidase/D-alanyl-D-alanine-endopeptidase [Gemmatimonadales bacterium]
MIPARSLPALISRTGAALGILVAAGAAPVHAQSDNQWLEAHVADWYESAARQAPGAWGIAIADQQGRLLWGVRPDEPLVPASTVKLFTTGFARSVVGGGARRPTRVIGTGHLNSSTGEWVGPWSLELNGDVTLERAQGSGPTLFDLAEQLAAAGVRRISGPLRVQSADGPADAVFPSVWSSRHRGRLFAPLIGPLTLHENVVWFTVRPGARVGQRVQLVEESPQGIGSLVTIVATTRSGRANKLKFQQRAGGGWVVSGKIGIRAGARRFTTVANNPKAVLGAAWGYALRRAGVAWTHGGAAPLGPDAPRVLAEVNSPVFDSVASEVNRRSLNIGAELLLQWAAGRGAQAPLALMQHIREVTGEQNGAHLVDGSGLSNEDRVTPSTFVAYLARFPATPAGRNFPQLLPANGSGTLRRMNTGFPGAGVIRAKTGTLSDVSTVVGYLGRPDGVLLVSLMYNGPRPWAARQAQWQLFRLLGADGVVIPTDSIPESTVQFGGEPTPPAPKWWPLPARK